MACRIAASAFVLALVLPETGSTSIPLTRHVVRVPYSTQGRSVRGSAEERGFVGLRDRRTQEEVPVLGKFRDLAYFYADVFIGTPSQKFTVIADTGSTLMAVPCVNCADCGFTKHYNRPYDPAASSSALACGDPSCPTTVCQAGESCTYSVHYAEGSSLSGNYWRDRVFLGDENASTAAAHARFTLPTFRFGCHTHEGGLFVDQAADGIMGLGSGGASIIPALIAAPGALDSPLFSLCLALDGGAMTLGAMDKALHLGPLQWGPLSTAGFYVVRVEGLSVVPSAADLGAAPSAANGWGLSSPQAARLPSGSMNSPHTIVDSGTSFTYVPTDVFNALTDAVRAYCGGGGERCVGESVNIPNEGICYRLASPAALSTFPGLIVELQGGVTVDVAAQHLFINMGWEHGAYCLGIYSNGGGGGVLGGNTMMGHDVVFDLTPGAQRLGWAPSACVPHSSSLPPVPVSASPSASSSVSASASASASMLAVAVETAAASPSASSLPLPSESSSPLPPRSSSPSPSTSLPASLESPSPAAPSAAATATPSGSALASSASPGPSSNGSSSGSGEEEEAAAAPPLMLSLDAASAPIAIALLAAAALVLIVVAACCCVPGPCELRCARLSLRWGGERGGTGGGSKVRGAAGGSGGGGAASPAAAAVASGTAALERGSINSSVQPSTASPKRVASAAAAAGGGRRAYAQLPTTAPDEQEE